MIKLDLIGKKIGIVLLCLIALSALILPVSAAGTGEVDNPFIVTNPTELQSIQNNLTAYYVLGNDIDLTGVTWTPIATGGQFLGELNGAGHTISNLNLNLSLNTSVGLFSVASSGASFKNITIDSFTVVGENNVGALVGYIKMAEATHDWCVIDNVDVTNSNVRANTSYAGSIYGFGQTYAHVRMNDCDVSDGKVTTGSTYCGGLVGAGAYTSSVLEMTECTAVRMSVTTGSYSCGGLVGNGAHTSSVLNVTDCIVRDSVITTGSYHCGGLVGNGAYTSSVLNLNGNEVENCVITTGSPNCGGLVGNGAHTSSVLNVNDCEVNECTVVATTSSAGGIVGETYQSTSSITNSFVTDTTVLAGSGKAGGVGGNLDAVNATVSTCNVANVNVKGATTYTFAEVFDAGSCVSSDITNVAGRKLFAQDLSVFISTVTNIETFTLQRQGAVVRTDGSGFVDTSLGYVWSWGDGSTGVDFTDTPTHSYSAAGDYTTSVTITNTGDLVGSSKSVSFTLLGPTATITSPSPTTKLLTGETYTFTATTANGVSYLWNFGDGTTAATESATHAYSASGDYNISLTVTNPYGSYTTYLNSQSLASTFSYTVEDVTMPATAAIFILALIPLSLAGILVFTIINGNMDTRTIALEILTIGTVFIVLVLVIVLAGTVDDSVMNVFEVIKGFK